MMSSKTTKEKGLVEVAQILKWFWLISEDVLKQHLEDGFWTKVHLGRLENF